MYDTTTCWSRRQFLVKPMNSGVFSLTCGFGGRFQSGIFGRSLEVLALAALGKLSLISGGFSGAGLYIGLGRGLSDFSVSPLSLGIGTLSYTPVRDIERREMVRKMATRAKTVRFDLASESIVAVAVQAQGAWSKSDVGSPSYYW